MNREIKFRVFNEVDNKMQNVVSLWHNPKSEIAHVVVALNEEYTEVDTLFRGYKLMQYTGLKDKNGKEIYEGDINQDKGIIVWEIDSACFCWDYKNIEMMPLEYENEWCEIIGNIHENPELL